ncbi:MAG: hypothetical protein EBX50_12365 [Chitinophagia bacterium]|nr:hypothetical protein [Chitinophagia bacterium]
MSATTITVGTVVSTLVTSGSVAATSATIGNVQISGAITTSNIHTNAGTLGPFVILQQHFIDMTTGSHTGYTSSNTIVFSEDGNPGVNSAIGNSSGFGRLSDGSNDGMSWSYARLIMRGVALNTGTTGSTVILQPFAVQSNTGTLYTQSSFTVTDAGSDCGYTTWVSPWFSTNIVSDIQSLGVKALSLNGATGGNVRIGTTYLQFK